MIDYLPKHWTQVTFAYRGTVLSRLWPRIAGYGILTAGTVGVDLALGLPDVSPLAHSLVGIAMGMLLVFRTNTSYDRFWEGRKRWGGIVNASRNLVRGGSVYAGTQGGKSSGDAAQLAQLVSAYAHALKQHLRGQEITTATAPYLDAQLQAAAAAVANPPARIAVELSRWIATRLAQGKLPPELARRLEDLVCELLDHQGACERILKTPIPFAYVVQIRQLLMVYLLTLPVVLASTLGWLSVPAVALIAFALLGIEEAGIEIEDPFGTDANDLPLDAICEGIARDLAQLAAA